MPCQSYEDDHVYQIEQNQLDRALRDKLARIACKALTFIENELLAEGGFAGMAIKGILTEDEIAWWKQHKIDDKKAMKKEVRKAKQAAEREALLKSANAKLTKAERKALLDQE